MKHINYRDEEAVEVQEEGARGIKMRVVIGEKDGAPNFYMRTVAFEPGARNAGHSHPWEHEVFVLEGSGIVEINGEIREIKAHDVLYIPPNAHHHFEAPEGMEFV